MHKYQVFFWGMLLLLVGLQFRYVDSYTLTSKATKYLSEETDHPIAPVTNAISVATGAEAPIPPKVVPVPGWLGFLFLSAGGVMVVQSLVMAKPSK